MPGSRQMPDVAGGENLKLLVVDDEPIVHQMIDRIVESSDLPVTVAGRASSGEDAMRLCAEVCPDICILDILMGEMTGLELAARLAEAGFAVGLLHHKTIPSDFPTLAGLSLRMMGAVCAAADLIVAVDTAAFHWGGILGRPTIGIFNVNDGAAYCRYYPTARFVQTCAQPCINVRYGPGEGTSPKH